MGILIFSFFFFYFVSAYPTGNRLITYRDILPPSPDLNNIINFDIRALIQDSVQKTLKEIPSFNGIFQEQSFLPLSNNLLLNKPINSFSDFKNLINFKDFNTDNAYNAVKSIIILTLRLFVVALVSIAEVLKVFIDLLTKGFK